VPAPAAAAPTAAAAAARRLDLVAFTLIVDDLVFSDGSTSMGRLGGGGAQALLGFLAAAPGAAAGLAAGVGADLPPAVPAWLARNGVDASGLLLAPGAETPHAWQLLEADGRRTEVFRSPAGAARDAMLLPPLASLPSAYRAARAYHLGVHPERPPLPLLADLRRAAGAGGVVSVETFAAAARPVPAAGLAALCAACDVFSPNEGEAASMLFAGGGSVPRGADDDPTLLTAPFLDAGARVVALRRGTRGAVVHDASGGGRGRAWAVPAVPGVEVVDTTGCGNAFCGAFLAAIQAGAPAERAAAWGCAAASVVAESRGVPAGPAAALAGLVRRRAEALAPVML
jgi:sugar/nucleoside kinase (ribokinase family)